jgi:RNA polymerase primary sigma factor
MPTESCVVSTVLLDRRSPLLDAERERDLLKRLSAGNAAREQLEVSPGSTERAAQLRTLVRAGESALEQLVTSNVRLAGTVARRFAGGDPDRFEDLFQEALIGLVSAANDYEPQRGTRFTTWAVHRLTRMVAQGCRWVPAAPMCEPEEVHLDRGKVNRVRDELAVQLASHAPSPAQVAERLGWTLHRVERVWVAPSGVMMSRVLTDRSTTTFAEGLCDDVDVTSGLEEQSLRSQLAAALRDCELEGRQLLVERFGLDGSPPRSLVEIAQGGDIGALHRQEVELLRQLRKLEQLAAWR